VNKVKKQSNIDQKGTLDPVRGGGEWSVSCAGSFIPGTCQVGRLVGPRSWSGHLRERKFLAVVTGIIT
jgi:hypothetical protein